jgi:hypothetical protein
MNSNINVGDKVMCLYMAGETSVPAGTKGTVTRIIKDPFDKDPDSKIIEVNWDNGSRLSLVTSTDGFKKVKEKIIKEDQQYLADNLDITRYFDWRFFMKFLNMIRESGIINMFGSAPLLYAGPDHIERYYGEGKEDNEAFQQVLENAEESKNKLIQGILNYMEDNNQDIDDIDKVNRMASRFSKKLLRFYISITNVSGNLPPY